MRTALLTLALVSLSLSLSLSSASAQDEVACEEGRERVEGRCCWPGQRWSAELGRCEGAPTCPEALVEHGDACIAPATALPMAAAPVPMLPSAYGGTMEPLTSASSTASWPLAETDSSAPTRRAVRGRGEDEGLITFALALFDVGWVLGWMAMLLEEAVGGGSCGTFSGFGSTRHSCDSWPLGFIPLVGSLLGSIVTFDGFRQNSLSLALSIPSLIIQFAGLIAIPIAFANETTESSLQMLPRGSALRVSLELSAPGTDVGLGLRVSF